MSAQKKKPIADALSVALMIMAAFVVAIPILKLGDGWLLLLGIVQVALMLWMVVQLLGRFRG